MHTEVGTQTAAAQPSSGDDLSTINKALQISEMHCQTPRTISLDAMVPTPARVAPPCVPSPVSVVLPNASSEITDTLENQVATLQATVCQNEERIAVLENHITRISGIACQDGTDHDLNILGVSQLEDRIQEDAAKIEERLSSLESTAKCGAKPEEFYIGADAATFSGAAALDVVDEEECLAEPGLCKANETEAQEPSTAAQYSGLNRIVNSSIMQTLDSFIDLMTP